jgi:hypothetical protein
MTSHWIWPISRDNFKILRSQDHGFMDFKERGGVLSSVALGDKVGVYISKRYGGRMHIEALLEVRSELYKRQPGPPTWHEELASGRVEWPYRIDSVLIRECDVDLAYIFPRMEAPSPKEKNRGTAGLGLFLQGATLRRVTDKDWKLIEDCAGGEQPQGEAATEAFHTAEESVELPVPRPRRRVFGPPLNFRELRHEPINESGVIYLFGMVAGELGFLVESIAAGFPDCDAKRATRGGFYERVKIEFEYKASNFRLHGHDASQCDLVICWENDWPACPIDVLELRQEIRRLQA